MPPTPPQPGPKSNHLPPVVPYNPQLPWPPPPSINLPPIQYQPGFGNNPPPLPNRPPQITDVTWLRIISQQLGQVIRIMEGGRRGSGGAGGGGGGRGPGHPLARLGNFWTNISNLFGGFGQIGRGIGRLRGSQAAYGATRAGQAIEALEKMFGGGGGGAGAAGGAARGAAGVARGAAGLAGAASAAVTVVGVAVAYASMIAEVKRAADELIQFNRKLADVSANMGLIYAQREFREIMRERARGDELANSTGLLVRGEQRFKDEVFPWEVAWSELKSNFLAGFYENLADTAENVNAILELLGVEVKKRNATGSQAWSDMINRTADNAQRKQDAARRRARGQ
jgi:hypothetical protein